METIISLPKAPKVIKQLTPTRALLEIDKLYPGYGLTIGNALRRVMLSSLPGAAITSVKIKDVSHEFSTLPGIREDMVEIILNLKQIRFIVHGDEPQSATLKVKGEKEATAKDIKTSSQIEVVNLDAQIATLTTKNASLEMELNIEKGIGYVTVESRRRDKQETGVIAIDAIFPPIKMVKFDVEDMRVGEKTNYNRLIFDIETDGTIAPDEALKNAADLLMEHLKMIAKPAEASIIEGEPIEIKKEKTVKKETVKEDFDGAKMKIEDLKLSNRTQNILLINHIKTVANLLRLSKDDLLDMEDLGEKAVKEIKKSLGKLGLTLRQEE